MDSCSDPVPGLKRSRSEASLELYPLSERDTQPSSDALEEEEEGEVGSMEDSISSEGQLAREDVLGNEDMLKILFSALSMRNLCRVSGVCRMWREVSQADEFWKVINLEGSIRRPNQVLQLLKRHPNVQELDLRFVSMDGFMARPIFNNLKRVKVLRMGDAVLSEECLTEASGQMPELHCWIVSGAILGVSNTAMAVLSHQNVQQLIIESCVMGRLAIRGDRVTQLSLKHSTLLGLSLTCPRLTTLGLQSCQKITDFALRTVLSKLTSLTDLDVSENMHLSDETLREVGIHCTGLTRLAARGCVGLTLNTLRGFQSLRTLDLSRCDSLAPAAMVMALESWVTLEELCVDACGTLTQLSLSMPRLRSLSVQGCRSLTQLELRCPWLEGIQLGANLTCVLKRIELASTSMSSICWRGISSLEHVSLHCPNLTSLDLSCCEALADSVFANLGDRLASPPGYFLGGGSHCPSLRHLKLDNCSSLFHADLRSASLQHLSLAGCKNLRELVLEAPHLLGLHLDECDQLNLIRMTPIGVRRLSLGTCPRLQLLDLTARSLAHLDLMGCGMLDSLHLDCPALERLDCTYCRSLPSGAIAALAAGAPGLNSLVISVCSSIDRPGLLSLRSLRHLTLLDLSYTEVEMLDPVFEACPGLVTLKLLSCRLLRADALQALLPGHGSAGQALPRLTDLDVSYCNRLQTPALADLLLQGRQLKVIEVNGCEGMTDSICERLHSPEGHGGASHALEVLSAKGCKNLRAFWLGVPPPQQSDARLPPSCQEGQRFPLALSEPAPAMLATPLTGLKVLRLGLSAIRSLSLALPNLAVLDVSNCADLWRLQLRCPRLVEAYFQSCRCLSAPAIAAQLRGCKFLERVGLQQSEVEDKVMAVIRAGNPTLQIVPPPA